MLPNFFKAMKSHNPNDRKSFTNHKTNMDLSESTPEIPDTMNRKDLDVQDSRSSEKALDSTGVQDFNGFSDEGEPMEGNHCANYQNNQYSGDEEFGNHQDLVRSCENDDQSNKEDDTMNGCDVAESIAHEDKGPAANHANSLRTSESNVETPAETHLESATHSDMADDHSASNTDSLRASPEDLSLHQYQPSPEQSFMLDRKCKTPPPQSKSWSIPPTWPAPNSDGKQPSVRSDILPPKGSPLHVQIQAYSLRWGTWAATIKDDDRREEVLKWVTEKMRAAWDTAIKEGYYPRPNQPALLVDNVKSENDAQTKRGRKKAVSPSRQTAPFACDGKDRFAITMGELADAGITMESIDERVAKRDFDDGEMLLDEILTNLNKEKIEVRDWSRYQVPNVNGRNLLNYSLYVVQESRAEIQKLDRLLAGFKKESQKKNTRNRIETYQERADQHLALAAELRLSQQRNGDTTVDVQEESANTDDVQQIDSASPSESLDDHVDDDSSADEQDELSEDDLYEIAQEVVSAKDEAALVDIYQSQNLQREDFAVPTNSDGNLDYVQHLKQMLGQIYDRVEDLVAVRNFVNKTDSPSDKMKWGHQIRLDKDRIAILQNHLRKSLGHREMRSPVTNTTQQPTYVQTDVTNTHQYATDFKNHKPPPTPIQQHIDLTVTNPESKPPRDFRQTSSTRTISSVTEQDSPESPQRDVTQQQQSPQAQSQMPNLHSSPQIDSPADANTSHEEKATKQPSREDIAKQAYIEHMYRPWLDQLLRNKRLPPVQGSLPAWQDIKDVLVTLGFTSAQRNVVLNQFKAGFCDFLTNQYQIDQDPTQAMNLSPITEAVSSPETPKSSHSQPQPTMQTHAAVSQYQNTVPLVSGIPTDAEILAAIPPQGISGVVLAQQFLGRYNGDFHMLVNQVRRIAMVRGDNMIYPPNNGQAYRSGMIQSSPTAYGQVVRGASVAAPPSSQSTVYNYGSSPCAMSQSSAPAPPSASALKVNSDRKSRAQTPGPQAEKDEQGLDEFSSREVISDRGFSFRYLPTSTLQQRKDMDDAIEDYITSSTGSRKRRPFGQYVRLSHPSDPSFQPIVHGFWDLDAKGTKRSDVDWFYDGGDLPTTSVSMDKPGKKSMQAPDNERQATPKPKIRLNVNPASSRSGQTTLDPAGSTYNPYGTNPQFQSLSRPISKKGNKRPIAEEVKSVPKSRKKRRTMVDDDSDSEYDPKRDD